MNTLAPIVSYDPIPAATYGNIATLLRQANIGWVRQDFDWGRALAVEAYKRDTSLIDWGPMDAAVNNAVCRGLNVLGNLAYTPAWATAHLTSVPDSLRWRYLPGDMNDWAAFVKAAVVHYPQIRYWSIWNEPNASDFFGGAAPGRTTSELIGDYNQLIQYAAPIIRGDVDGRGPRQLVAPELGAAPLADATTWLNGVLGPAPQGQGANVDIITVHDYGDANDVVTYMQGVLDNTTKEVWLTEAGRPRGCNDKDQPSYPVAPYCGPAPNFSYMDDQYQASHLQSVLTRMGGRWTKTFYWHSHLDVRGVHDGSNNDGIISGAYTGALTRRPAYWTYTSLASPLGVTGSATYASNQNVTVRATPAVPGSYYYVWEYQWCYNGNAAGDCDRQWHWYNEGQDVTSIAPYVYRQDYYVYTRVRQYAWQNGPQISEGEWDITGPGQCTSPGGCGGGGGGGMLRSTPSATTSERLKGHKGGKNK